MRKASQPKRTTDARLAARIREVRLSEGFGCLAAQLTQLLAAVLSAEPEWAKSAYVDAGTVPVEGGGLGRIFARLRLSETGPVEVEFGVASWEEIYVFAELSRLPTRKTLQDAPATTRALVDRLFAREFSLTNPRRPVRATWGITPARLASHDLPGDAAAWIVERLSAAHMAGAFDAPATGG